MKNEDAPIEDFKFTTKKMSNSGALFDINKLNDVAKDVMLKIPAKDIAEWLRSWSDQFAPEYADMFEDMDYLEKILDIGREDRKPRKDLVYARQIVDFISYFFDKHFKIEDQIPEEVKNKRSEDLISLGKEMSEAFRSRHDGRRAEVLTEQEGFLSGKKMLFGYTKEYIRAAVPAETGENRIVSGILSKSPDPEVMLLL